MRWIVDRIEADLAVVACGEARFEVPLAALPAGTAEGSVIGLEVLAEATEEARAAAKTRFQTLAQADDGQDFSL